MVTRHARFGLGAAIGLGLLGVMPASAQSSAQSDLFVVYPSNGHVTTAAQIFLIGTAPPAGAVEVNGQVITRSDAGHFAPSFPLELGGNTFNLQYGDQTLTIQVTRQASRPPVPVGNTFGSDSLMPSVDIARQPGEVVCFGAIAPPNAAVAVTLGGQTLPLQAQSTIDLPPNSAVLTEQNQPVLAAAEYQGCTTFSTPGDLGQPQFRLTASGETVTQSGPGRVEILPQVPFDVATVISESGVARTGPSTSYSRITPLPKGTQATVTGREGSWLRLDYGGWVRAGETQVKPQAVPPRSLIRSARSRQVPGWTEVIFPLQVPVPIEIDQQEQTLTLTLHNTIPQTDTIFFNDDPAVARMDWHPVLPDQAQYTFTFKSKQQWGYKVRYEGTSLILSLKHPPQGAQTSALDGVSVLLDPGHGSSEDLGARGPNGYPEKEVTLIVSKLLREELQRRGAIVPMTREGDDDLFPRDRVKIINDVEPAIALSIHYNALPDSGDAVNTAGIGTFWYNAQAQDLAVFLHNYLTEELDRPSYGVFWNNLALTRPTVTPAVLLELGFMINPEEFEWIVDPEAQQQLAMVLADGIEAWFEQAQ